MADELSGAVAEMRAAAAARGIELSGEAEGALLAHLRILLLWRRRISLVSQEDPIEIIRKHFEDSFSLAPLVETRWQIVDLGSGAGFPGLVLAVLVPASSVVLIESRRRKVSFLRAVVREIGARNVRIVGERSEDAARHPGMGGNFDLAVSRAVWSAREFFARALPFLRSGAIAVAMKTPDIEPVELPGYESVQQKEYSLRGGERRALLMARRRFT